MKKVAATEAKWREMRLDQIGRIISGGTPSTSNLENWDGPIRWVTPTDLSELRTRHLNTTQRTLTESGLASGAARMVPARSLVISSRAPIGHMALPLIDFCTNQGCKSIAFYEKQNPDFHFYNLRFRVRNLHEKGEGTTFAEISKTAMEGVVVAVPEDENVQKAIASILVKLDDAIEQTDALLAKRQRINTGLMHDLLTRGLDAQGHLREPSTDQFHKTDIGEIPKDWEVFPIEKLVPPNSPICYGIVQVGSHFHGGVPTIAIHDFDDIRVEKVHQTDPKREKLFARSRCQGGDVLVAIKGATAGKIGLVPDGFHGNISRDLARIRLLPSECSAFFKYQLQDDAGQLRLDTISVGSTRKELSILPLRQLLVSRPKPSEQHTIVVRIQESEADLFELNNALAKLRRVKSGLMHDLLTGTVPVTPLLSKTPDT